MAFDLDTALETALALGASDLHVKVPSVPRVRINGRLRELEGFEPVRPEDAECGPRARAAQRREEEALRRDRRGRPLLLHHPRPLPRGRVHPARLGLLRLPRDPVRARHRDPRACRPPCSAGPTSCAAWW